MTQHGDRHNRKEYSKSYLLANSICPFIDQPLSLLPPTHTSNRAFLEANPNKLVIVKVFAPWCKACKGLEPKYLAISKDPKFDGLPIVWADLTVTGNKAYIKEQGIIALPTMLFYAGSEGLMENFPCGPSKIPILKTKLAQFVNDWVDTKTMQLKVMVQPSDLMAMDEDEPCAERRIVGGSHTTDLTVDGVSLSNEAIAKFRQIPFFKDFAEDEFLETLQKAKLRTWEKGSVIMREGKKGRTFYVIESGEVEILVKTAFEDPMATPNNYLGTMINRLSQGEYFGERALITGEPRAASVRAAVKTRCFAFDKDDIPVSSVLSGKAGQATPMRLAEVNNKYGVDVSDLELIQVRKSIEDSKLGSQIRGSVNSPQPIRGVDAGFDLEDEDDNIPAILDQSSAAFSKTNNDTIINLLQRLRIIKYAARCFNYITKMRPSWTSGAQRRRSMLVDKLSAAQTQEFKELFSIIDVSGDNAISLWELKRVMECIGEEKTDSELKEMVTTGHSGMDGSQVLTFDGFMGIMAEAEFYQLFTDTFSSLDRHNTGFVKAQDLDRILCGMRDLISDDRKSIIDVEDKEMMIDYEQFSRMLLGGSLQSGGDLSP
jgi:calmodulin